jgi:serine/threonine protein kinase
MHDSNFSKTPCNIDRFQRAWGDVNSPEPAELSFSERSRVRSLAVCDVIAAGAFGTVFIGSSDSRPTAIKIVDAIDDADVTTALSEPSLQSALSHPNVVSVESYFRAGRQVFSVMELCLAGGAAFDLDAVLRAAHGHEILIDECLIWQWVRDMASALEYLKDNGIAHGDVKPRNSTHPPTNTIPPPPPTPPSPPPQST